MGTAGIKRMSYWVQQPVRQPFWLLLWLLCGWSTTRVAADSSADGLAYVIKATPTLAYIDVGDRDGVAVGDWYIALRPRPQQGLFVQAGQMRVVRVSAKFSIAEILSTTAGERVVPLHRAISLDGWQAMARRRGASSQSLMKAPQMGEQTLVSTPRERPKALKRRTLYLLAGLDWGKAARPVWIGDLLVGAKKRHDRSLAARLVFDGGRAWRLGLSARLAGRALGGKASNLAHLGLELDLHYVLSRGRLTPYVGAGVGWHQLDWKSPGQKDGQADKAGFQTLAGIETALGQGRWNLLIEGGYQYVAEEKDLFGGGLWRSYIGLGYDF